VRSALYQSATATQRRAAHRVLASVFGALSTPRAQERHAWHLAAAALGPDEEVAAALDAAAGAAAARRSYATAMDIQERAAWLSWPGDDRAGRLMKAANMSFPAGRVQAGLLLLDQVLDETGDWRLRTEAQHFRCRILMWGGQPVAGRDLLIAEANQVEPQDPAWSAIMRAHAALTSFMLGDQRLAAAEGQRAVELLAGLPDSLTMPALVVRALTLAVSGPVAEARSLLARSEEHLPVWDPLDIDQVLLVAALAPAMAERGHGAIVNITSGLAYVPMARVPVYCATKAALHSFTLSLRHQLAKTPIEVIEIAPPAVNTDLGGPGLHTFGVPLDEFVDAAVAQLQQGKTEIGYGFSEEASRASGEERQQIFARMNQD